MTMNALAASLFLEKSSASRLVDGLVRKGYVTRRTDASNGRFVRLELTKPGNSVARRLEDDLIDERRDLLDDLSGQERKVVVRSFARLARAAAAGIKTEGGCRVRR